jgi:hypothetical protein
MTITGIASLVRRAGRVVALGLAALAIAGGGMLAAPPAPASAASAVTVALHGDHVVYDWDTATSSVAVYNAGTTTLHRLCVAIALTGLVVAPAHH